VTTIPELERDLRRVAEHHYRRAPSRRILTSFGYRARRAVPLGLAVASLAGGMLVVTSRIDSGPGSSPRTDPETTAPAPPVRTVQDVFAIFRRPSQPGDTVRFAHTRSRATIERGGARLDVTESRLVAHNDQTQYFVVPADTAQGPATCIVATDRNDNPAGDSCGHLAQDPRSDQPMTMTTMRADHRQELFVLVPDAIQSVAVTLRDGERKTLPVHDNGALATFNVGAASLDWTDASGTTHGASFQNDPADPSD
jgi:hypothetical protein